jgi:hypothetical protein
VRGDRRRLGDDVEVGSAEHFVAAAGDGFLCGGDDPEQDVTQRITATDLACAFEEETARSIVQQRGVGGA